ncbi:MAG: helix-turn-helix domain-containing protein [Ktedonobacteraceae bacterium]|nr:helix-turn-helix domain-containing protein [Ktedonobacteraceae bacterium]
MNKDDLLDVETVADELGVRIETVRKWIRKKQLNAINLGRRGGYRIRRSALEEFLRQRETIHNTNGADGSNESDEAEEDGEARQTD